MFSFSPENNERQSTEQRPTYEPIIKPDQWDKIKDGSLKILNDALALLFDPDNRIKPLCKNTHLSFTFIIAAIFILLGSLLTPKLPPVNLSLFFYKGALALFFGNIFYFFATALSIYVCIRVLVGSEISYIEGLNIVSISFIPLIIAFILGAIFSLIHPFFVHYFETIGYLISILLVFSALQIYLELPARAGIYLIPIIYTVSYILVYLFLNLIS